MSNHFESHEDFAQPRLIPRLRAIQESSGYLPRPKLEALSTELGIPLHKIHEIVSFFPHYRLKPAAPVHVRVCRDLACTHAYADDLKLKLEERTKSFGGDRVSLEWTSCLGLCDRAPALQTEFDQPGKHAVTIDDHGQNPDQVAIRLESKIKEYFEGSLSGPFDSTEPHRKRPQWRLDYLNHHGESLEEFHAVRSFVERLKEANTAEAKASVFQALNDSMKLADLRGMGGAGVPTFRKWLDVKAARGARRYVICNGDESEPLTFKDRELLLHTPEIVLEGMIFGGLFTGATLGYVYIRHEYPAQIHAMEQAIKRAYDAGALGADIFGTGLRLDIEVFISPGGYVCGEQSALIEAIEEKRSEPRNKPPQIETNGLYDCPTVLNNVETFAWVPSIAHHGGGWYAGSGVQGGPWYGRQGRRNSSSKGLRFFSICGDVRKPGVHEVPNGTTLGELIELSGGIIDNLPLFAFAPSGPSGGFLPAKLTRQMIAPEYHRAIPADQTEINVLDLPLDLDEFRTLGLMLGAGMMIYADRPGRRPDMLAQALSATRFYRRESCGKCVPCRVGCQKLVEIGEGLTASSRNDLNEIQRISDLVQDLSETLELTSICGLGTSAPKPLSSYMAYFLESETQRNES